MYMTGMKIGYAFQKPLDDLRNAGAERCFYDASRLRQERADMVRAGLREGDTLLLYSLRNLGGSPVADAKWEKIVEDLGVTIEIVPSANNSKPMGRRPKYGDLTDDQLSRMKVVWLDPILSELERIQQCNGIAKRQLTRGWLHGRWPRGAR